MKVGKDVLSNARRRVRKIKNQVKTSLNNEYLKKLGGKVPTKLVGQGMPASIGLSTIVTGKVRIAHTPQEAMNIVKEGDILVTSMTDPDYVPIMKRASAIITERGGIASHAAIVARELRIPAIVGVKGAMKRLKSGRMYYIDVRRGKIYEI